MIIVYNEEGVAWAFRKHLVSILIDFYLEKQSPLGNKLCAKKNPMGNQYSLPEFTPLVQTVVYLAMRDKRIH